MAKFLTKCPKCSNLEAAVSFVVSSCQNCLKFFRNKTLRKFLSLGCWLNSLYFPMIKFDLSTCYLNGYTGCYRKSIKKFLFLPECLRVLIGSLFSINNNQFAVTRDDKENFESISISRAITALAWHFRVQVRICFAF